MLRYLGPKLKKLKRLRLHIQPGFSRKYCFLKENNNFNKIITSIYLLDLLEKQKLKLTFSLSETFIKSYIKYTYKYKYKRFNLLNLIDKRLDTIIYEIGYCISIRQARHLINHGHFFVNYNLVKKPSYKLKEGDIIIISNKSYYIYMLLKKNLFNKYYKYTNISSKKKVFLCFNTLTSLVNFLPIFTNSLYCNISSVFNYYTI